MKFIALLFFFSSFVYSIEPMDDYYAADLLEAVDQAKARPHHYDYSNHYRYKRTTAQSIDLNRLNLQELDETRLKATQPNASASDDIVIANNQNNNSSIDDFSDNSLQEVQLDTSLFTSTSYETLQGKFSSSGITGESILKTTVRP